MTAPRTTRPSGRNTAGTSSPQGWDTNNGLLLLRTLATAVVRLHETPNPGTFTLPYPDDAQRGLDRTVLACLRRGADPPRSVPDLIAWCRDRPIVDWPLDIPDDAVSGDDVLIDAEGQSPTQLCYEWAIDGPDAAARRLDRQVVRTAIRMCRDHQSPDSYTAFRRLLVMQPVMTAEQVVLLAANTDLAPVLDLISGIYQPAPAGYANDGRFTACRRCLTLLVPTTAGGWWCERDRCRQLGAAPIGKEYATDEGGGVLQLTRPLRQFVTGPGRAEVELERKLTSPAVTIEMWPSFDSYDLRVHLPDGRIWAVDVKDWANPALLGRKAKPVPTDPPYDEAFWVVPHYRMKQRKGYRDVFHSFCSTQARSTLTLLTDREFTAKVRQAERVHAAADSGAKPNARNSEVFDA